jgi:hypothetical protein
MIDRHDNDDEIEAGVQHDIARLREIWTEQGYGRDADDIEQHEVLGRLDRIEQHLGIK